MLVRLPAILLTSFALGSACSYDWDVGPAPSTADAGDANSADVGSEASATCLAIIELLDQKRPSATQCVELMVGAECTDTGKDECGCVIGGLYPTPFDEYLALVDEFNLNECTKSCPGCAASIAPTCTADPNGSVPHCQ